MAAKRRAVDEIGEDDDFGLVRLMPGQIVVEESFVNALMAYADRAAVRDTDLYRLNDANFTGLRGCIDVMRVALEVAYSGLERAHGIPGAPPAKAKAPVTVAAPKPRKKAR